MESGWKPRPWAVPLESHYIIGRQACLRRQTCALRLQTDCSCLKKKKKKKKTDRALHLLYHKKRTDYSGGNALRGAFFELGNET